LKTERSRPSSTCFIPTVSAAAVRLNLSHAATRSAFGVLAAAVKQAARSPRPRYNDLWMAAQAIEHGYALLTLNARDFAALPGLRLVALEFTSHG
jgi:predicted nucleic acid-binding protein